MKALTALKCFVLFDIIFACRPHKVFDLFLASYFLTVYVGISKFGQMSLEFPASVARDYGRFGLRILIGQAEENPSERCKTDAKKNFYYHISCPFETVNDLKCVVVF